MGPDIFSHASLKSPDNFNPRVPCGTRRHHVLFRLSSCGFQSTGPVWDPTMRHKLLFVQVIFQSTGPVWDPTSSSYRKRAPHWHFNPRVPCGTRRQILSKKRRRRRISIHGSRVGPDILTRKDKRYKDISIHGSRVGPDGVYIGDGYVIEAFQSTGPVWDPTTGLYLLCCSSDISIHGSRVGPDHSHGEPLRVQENFNPRVPCGTRLLNFRIVKLLFYISIHGSRVGPDNVDFVPDFEGVVFQSTGPVWDPTTATAML